MTTTDQPGDGARTCATCGTTATCRGAYEGATQRSYACDPPRHPEAPMTVEQTCRRLIAVGAKTESVYERIAALDAEADKLVAEVVGGHALLLNGFSAAQSGLVEVAAEKTEYARRIVGLERELAEVRDKVAAAFDDGFRAAWMRATNYQGGKREGDAMEAELADYKAPASDDDDDALLATAPPAAKCSTCGKAADDGPYCSNPCHLATAPPADDEAEAVTLHHGELVSLTTTAPPAEAGSELKRPSNDEEDDEPLSLDWCTPRFGSCDLPPGHTGLHCVRGSAQWRQTYRRVTAPGAADASTTGGEQK